MSLPNAMKKRIRPKKPCRKFEGHTDKVTDVISLPGGQRIMTSSNDGSLRVWDLHTGEQISNWVDGKVEIRAIALSANGKKVVSGDYDGVVRLWNIETEEVVAKWTGHMGPIFSVCWNGDDERVLSGSLDGTARVWGVESGKVVLEIKTGFSSVDTAIFSPDSTIIATGGDYWKDERIKIWNAYTGELISILKGHTFCVNCLAWTADRLISGSNDNTIRIWDTSTWQHIAVLTGHTGHVSDIALSPNDRLLASISWSYWDRSARLWNLDDGRPIGYPLQHRSDAGRVSFSADGTLLATACDDKNAYTWDVAAILEEAGLEELLRLDVEKSFLHANATPHPIQESESRLPEGFSAEAPQHPDPAIIHPVSLPYELHDMPSVPDEGRGGGGEEEGKAGGRDGESKIDQD